MKKILTIILISIVSATITAQIEYGIKAGVNYNFSGDLEQVKTGEIEENVYDVLHGVESKIGFHAGAFAKYGAGSLFGQVELQYSEFQNAFDTPTLSVLETKKIDIPIMGGVNVVGPLYLVIGPSFQYIIKEDFSLEEDKIKYEDFSIGLHIAARAVYNKFAMEMRWERGLNENEIEMTGIDASDYTYKLDNRPNQLLFSLQYSLF